MGESVGRVETLKSGVFYRPRKKRTCDSLTYLFSVIYSARLIALFGDFVGVNGCWPSGVSFRDSKEVGKERAHSNY